MTKSHSFKYLLLHCVKVSN